ncbi:gamma-glutamyl-gamma-aminobutyrate hydrolase family protein [Lichenicoccus roseus]|uniref:gamma-glutamyl-gamma-aminobutyrate hydrolase n=1 Tax=Lichenicoccus roseus TaxID=2683649 RepID=A0A5R9J885_9PROT|nr:gamma-glutamyl-gamma-aminobutyrate hydrolase family protein [Lichenicoccus roseus]TLU71831.1 gamma-glutamyl-gamma-aminobutyrate hydrolase family protein [Lichenicoccus roseus]
MKPLIGITTCRKTFGPFDIGNHAASDTYVTVTDRVVLGVPVLIPANGEAVDVETLVSRLDGLILTGSQSNVSPCRYGGDPHLAGTPEDQMRDAVTLPLARAAIAAGLPVVAICRGFQELNVALGGSLHQRLQDLPGRLHHSNQDHPDVAIRQGKAHDVDLTEGGLLHRLSGGGRRARVNSLHNQGIDRLAASLDIEALAPDGVVEAVRVMATPGLAIGVQWHPEYDFETDPLSRAIFVAFGRAVRSRMRGDMLPDDLRVRSVRASAAE